MCRARYILHLSIYYHRFQLLSKSPASPWATGIDQPPHGRGLYDCGVYVTVKSIIKMAPDTRRTRVKQNSVKKREVIHKYRYSIYVCVCVLHHVNLYFPGGT